MPFPRLRLPLLLATFVPALAQPLSRPLEIDFSREVLSRNIQGLAVRSDGRLLPGPGFKDLEGPKIADILWCLEPAGANRFLVGTGPEGQVHEVMFNPADSTYTAKSLVDVEESQVIAVLPLPDGSFLFGTSPSATLYLAKDGAVVARVPLPADSIFDLVALPDGAVLAATGNPGRIYRVDVAALAKAGIAEGKAEKDPKDAAAATQAMSSKGVTLFGEVRDRNVRRLARLQDGRIAAGSSPRGTIYVFPAPGAASAKTEPVILYEQREAEVVDLLPEPDGSVYAAIVTSPSEESRIARRETTTTPAAAAVPAPPSEPRTTPAFTGRSTVLKVSPDGFAETAALRNNISFYRLARHEGWLVFAAGEQGDTFGYDPVARRSLTFAGSASAQLNDLAPLGGGRYLVLCNNAPGLALLSFSAPPARELETKRLDLGSAAELGNLRFERVRDLPAGALKIEARTNHGSDEVEGWTPWTELKPRDGGWFAENLRGRYVKLRLKFQNPPDSFQLEKATLFHLPQNRRPQLSDFRIFPPNLGLLPQVEPQAPNVVMTLNQWLSPSSGDSERRKNPFLNSQVVPAPGTQLVYWSVSDPDSDNLSYTFSIRPEKAEAWTDLAVRTRESFAQFEVSHLTEGLYLTRLKVEEQGPRPAAQRLDYVFETDALVVDRTPPALVKSQVSRTADTLVISVTGRDVVSLLEGAQFNLNQGVKETVVHPADGIRDGREETFVAEIPLAKAAGATSVEVILLDQAGNALSTRLPVAER